MTQGTIATQNDVDFYRWHDRVKQAGKRYVHKQIGYYPLMMRPWYDEGLTPEQAFQRFKVLDQQKYQEWLAGINALASQYQGLTKSVLNTFIQWSSSRYNEYKKAEVVNIAFEVLVTGKESRTGKSILLFHCGTYSENTGWHYGDYLINGEEHYIASGLGDTVEHFQVHQRMDFPKKQEAVQ